MGSPKLHGPSLAYTGDMEERIWVHPGDRVRLLLRGTFSRRPGDPDTGARKLQPHSPLHPVRKAMGHPSVPGAHVG